MTVTCNRSPVTGQISDGMIEDSATTTPTPKGLPAGGAFDTLAVESSLIGRGTICFLARSARVCSKLGSPSLVSRQLRSSHPSDLLPCSPLRRLRHIVRPNTSTFPFSVSPLPRFNATCIPFQRGFYSLLALVAWSPTPAGMAHSFKRPNIPSVYPFVPSA